jgi:hypothetical protein
MFDEGNRIMLLSFARWRTPLVAVGLLALVCGLAGCARKGRAVVKGTVTFANKPLKFGTVSFFTVDNRVGTTRIANGSYTMTDAPIGDVKIVVTLPPPPGMMMGGSLPKPPPGMGQMKPPPGMEPKSGSETPMMDPRDLPRIPAKYTKAETTDLTWKVGKGEQTHNIELNP